MREKKKQRVVYDLGKTMLNRPASWKRSASEELTGSSPKRVRRTPGREEYPMNTFMEQLEIHVSSEILHCYQTGGNLGTTFPQSNRNISPLQTDQFNQLAAAFCTGNAVKLTTAGYST
ncbi:hypothetical protein RMATCC62417_17755 [Rhizopus microsporus]|nr:hypothetical protein RMATCC62417_17755 [Rhizopus microsporus]